jgi:hypothetical protein
MKTLQKYAKMTFLLLSVATVVPTYANSVDDYNRLKEQIIQQSTRPEMLKKIFQAVETACTIVGTISIVCYVPICIFTIYRGLKYGKWPR